MSQQTHLHPVQDSRARFEAGTETADRGTTPPPSGTDGDRPAKSMKGRADKPLPTDRLKFENQVAVLRNVAITSGNARRGSTGIAMSAALGLKGETGGLNNKFFKAAGWFEVVGRGEYTASAGVLAWNQHIGIDPDAQVEATAKMRDEVRSSWFWQALEPILASGQPINTRLALLELAKAAGASNHTNQLETILEWLVWVGLIVRNGDQVQLRTDVPANRPSELDEVQADSNAETGDIDGDDQAVDDQQDQAAPARAAAELDDAIVSFNMSVRLTADDLRGLDGDQRDFLLSLAERLRG